MLPHRSSPEPHTYSWWLYLEINRRMQQVIPPGESLCCSAASSARRRYRLLISTSVELCGLSFRLCRRGQLTLPPPRLGTRELQPYKLQRTGDILLPIITPRRCLFIRVTGNTIPARPARLRAGAVVFADLLAFEIAALGRV
jgi:hypothetical protein